VDSGQGPDVREGRHGAARWTLATDGQRAVVTLSGELDLAAISGPTTGILGALRDALGEEARVICDLSAVSFMDSTGLHLLLTLKRSVERRGGRFVLSESSPEVRRVIQVAGLDDLLGPADG
jgi:anti-sigma B factor antagonist